MSLYEAYETNADKESNGVEVQFPPNKDGSVPVFIIASTGKANKGYAKALEVATKPYRRIGVEAMGNELAEKVFREVFVTHVLKGWRNVRDRSDMPLEYTKENALKLMTDLPRLYQQLQEQANSIDLFKDGLREEEAGN